MTKADLIQEVAQLLQAPNHEADLIVSAMFSGIVRTLVSGGKVEIRGFGSFRTRQRRARQGRNPKTGASVDVPPKTIAYFKPSRELKAALLAQNV